MFGQSFFLLRCYLSSGRRDLDPGELDSPPFEACSDSLWGGSHLFDGEILQRAGSLDKEEEEVRKALSFFWSEGGILLTGI